jgi:hypothetical protein
MLLLTAEVGGISDSSAVVVFGNCYVCLMFWSE